MLILIIERTSAKISKIKTIESIHEGNGVAAEDKKITVIFFLKWFWFFRFYWVEAKNNSDIKTVKKLQLFVWNLFIDFRGKL